MEESLLLSLTGWKIIVLNGIQEILFLLQKGEGDTPQCFALNISINVTY